MIFEKTYLPRLSDLNNQKQVTYPSILAILEDIGSRHSSFDRNGILEEMDKGRTWIITEWDVEVKTFPTGDKPLNIKTWTYSKEKSYFMTREYLVEDENGMELLRAKTVLVLMDVEAKKPIRITNDELAPYNQEELSFIEEKPRLLPPKEWEENAEIRLRVSDFDYNGHLHNTKFLLLAEEISNLENFKNLRIVYKNPLKNTKTATLKKAISQPADNIASKRESTLVGIYDNETLCALIEVE